MNVDGYEIEGDIRIPDAFGFLRDAISPDGRKVKIRIATFDVSPDELERYERAILGSFDFADGFVPLLRAGFAGARPYFVMPFVRGPTLADVRVRSAIPRDDAIAFVQGLAETIGRAHARNVSHGNLAPSNVVLAEGGPHVSAKGPLIAELGLVQFFRKRPAGESGYVAPEVARGARFGPPADVYSLGLVLSDCLTGHRPWVSSPRPSVGDERIDAVLATALAPDPEDRYADGDELASALRFV